MLPSLICMSSKTGKQLFYSSIMLSKLDMEITAKSQALVFAVLNFLISV